MMNEGDNMQKYIYRILYSFQSREYINSTFFALLKTITRYLIEEWVYYVVNAYVTFTKTCLSHLYIGEV